LPANTTRQAIGGQRAEAITRHLQEWRNGDADALSRLTTALYSELRRVAAGVIKGSGSQTVRPTALVHELYFRLPALQATDWQNRGQFLNVAAAVMRNLLVDQARRKRAAKRGGGLDLELPREGPAEDDPNLKVDVLVVHDLLNRFATDYPRQAKVVELKFFGGLTEPETSEALRASGIESSERTVARDWKFARAWLHDQLEQGSAGRA